MQKVFERSNTARDAADPDRQKTTEERDNKIDSLNSPRNATPAGVMGEVNI